MTTENQKLRGAPEIVTRVMRYAGQTMREARNPCITARECIALANWIQAAIALPPEPAEGGEVVDEPQATPIPCAVHVAGRTFDKGTPFCDVIDHVESERMRGLVPDAMLPGVLWQDDDVMSLNAELGLSMDQIIKLAYVIRPLLTTPPASQEQAQRPKTQAQEPRGLTKTHAASIALQPKVAEALDAFGAHPYLVESARLVQAIVDEYNEIQPQAQEPARESDQQLMRFYGVGSLHTLIDAQEKHIAKLQAKLPRDNQPAFTKVREG